MSHKRQEIRQAVKTLLGGTSAGANVFASRSVPIWMTELPVILVYAREESSRRLVDQQSSGLERTLTLAIDVRTTSAEETLDDTLDALCLEVEDLINSDPTFGGLAVMAELTQTELDVTADGSKPIGGARLNYEVLYLDSE